VIDVQEEVSNKLVIFQKPNNKYFGIKQMIEYGLIHTFSDYSITMDELICELSKSSVPKIGIIRLREDGKGVNKLHTVERICLNYGITCKLYNQNTEDIDLTNAIETKPLKSHVIIVKGKMKMGKTIGDKRNVMFCMETAKKSNSDTLVQGFMGRFCGYPNKSENKFLNYKVKFYIHENNKNVPYEYVNYFATIGKTAPKTGMNILHKRHTVIYAPVIKIPLINKTNAKEKITLLNNPILNKIPENGYRFKLQGNMILEEGNVPNIQAGHGAKFGTELNIYNIGNWSYLLYAISDIPVETTTTTKKEIFSKRLKNLYQCGFVIGGPRIESFLYVNEMMQDIYTFIRASKITQSLSEKKIQNNQGIKMSLDVFEALKPKGMIYKKMKKMEDVTIKVGHIIHQDDNFITVKDISW
jgi:hypothetical protein